MKKSLWIMVWTTLLSVTSYAQDVITFRNGNEVKAKVLEIRSEEIAYKNEANPDGPTYYVKKGEVFMIKYANGTKDIFEATPAPIQKPTEYYPEDRRAYRRTEQRERPAPQENIERFNSVFIDNGGNGMYLSVNYERLFKIKDENDRIRHLVSTKLGYTPLIVINVINATASYNIGDGRNFLEVGGGAGYYFPILSGGGSNPYAFIAPIFGFRRMAPSGFLFRAYFSTYCQQNINSNYNNRSYTYSYTYNYTYYPFMGVSLGFSF